MSDKNKIEALKSLREAFDASEIELHDVDVKAVEKVFRTAKVRAKLAALRSAKPVQKVFPTRGPTSQF